MPIERRDIILSPEELMSAVGSFIRISEGQFPIGRVVGIRPCGQNGSGASLEVDINPHNCGDQVVTARRDAVAIVGLLVRFSTENNTPIPCVGRKLPRVVLGSVALHIVIDMVNV